MDTTWIKTAARVVRRAALLEEAYKREVITPSLEEGAPLDELLVDLTRLASSSGLPEDMITDAGTAAEGALRRMTRIAWTIAQADLDD